MIDIHTHILFDVDDGSPDIETSIKMILMEESQGVTDIVCTPHVQSRVTKADHKKQVKHFEILKAEVEKRNINVKLHLGAEILYHEHMDTPYELYQFGKEKYLLIEFHRKIQMPIEEVCYDLMHLGYQVIVAHIERYEYLTLDDIIKIKNTGALIQTNASAILKIDRLASKKMVKKLIKHQLIDVVATDTHHIDRRPPNLLLAKNALKKHYSKEQLDLLFNRIQL